MVSPVYTCRVSISSVRRMSSCIGIDEFLFCLMSEVGIVICAGFALLWD